MDDDRLRPEEELGPDERAEIEAWFEDWFARNGLQAGLERSVEELPARLQPHGRPFVVALYAKKIEAWHAAQGQATLAAYDQLTAFQSEALPRIETETWDNILPALDRIVDLADCDEEMFERYLYLCTPYQAVAYAFARML
jgi:hypothetical protein